MKTLITKTSDDYCLLDKSTGEITEYKQTKKVELGEFIQVYFSSCPQIMKLKGSYLKVLMCIWKYSTYNPANEMEGNLIYNTPLFKKYCHDEGVSDSNALIDNAFSKLNKEGIIIKKCRGAYMLNPEYFFKGSLSSRTKILYTYKVEPTDDSMMAS